MNEQTYHVDFSARRVTYCQAGGRVVSHLEGQLQNLGWHDLGQFVNVLEAGGYVARGVPVEEKPEASLALRDLFRDAMVRVGRANSFPQLFGGKPSATSTLANPWTTEPKRERLTWADTKPFNPFDGFLVNKGEVSQPTPASKFPSPDLKETSHQVSPGFGSAYIGKA